MRKIEVQELVKDFLAGGDAPQEIKGKYHDEIIANHIALAFNRIVFDTWLEAKAHSDYSVLDVWARNYTITITNVVDDNGDAVLPFPPVQLPNAMGILQVADPSDLTITYAYRDTNANSVFAALEVGSVSLKPTFYLEQTGTTGNVGTHALKLDKIPSGNVSVLVKMIVPYEEIDDYDDVALPAGKEDQLIGYVIQLLGQKPPEDTVNDEIAKQV